MTRVLVLGSKGILGQMVFRFLSRCDGVDVEHTCRAQKSDPSYFDVEDGLGRLFQIIEHYGPFDYFINCIGITSNEIDETNSKSVQRAILVNSLFPHELAGLAREIGVRVIHISTDGVFARDAGECMEDSPQQCFDIYGKTKSLGEVTETGFVNLRCSIIGPDDINKKGLLEWFYNQPQGAEVSGYTNHLWNGVTTLQFAKLCYKLILNDSFDAVRDEAHVHHFCPNQPLSKFELLQLFQSIFRPDVKITPFTDQKQRVSRILGTRYYKLKKLFDEGQNIQNAINELITEMKDRRKK